MRLMYVALTRAKEQLILIGTIDKEEALENLSDYHLVIKLHCINDYRQIDLLI